MEITVLTNYIINFFFMSLINSINLLSMICQFILCFDKFCTSNHGSTIYKLINSLIVIYN